MIDNMAKAALVGKTEPYTLEISMKGKKLAMELSLGQLVENLKEMFLTVKLKDLEPFGTRKEADMKDIG